MKKLSLLLGAIALVLVAMLTLGCENAADSKTVTEIKNYDHVYGTVSAADLQTILDKGRPVTLYNVTIGAGTVTLKSGQTLKIEGSLTIDATTLLNASAGTLDVSAATSIAGNTTGVIIPATADKSAVDSVSGSNTAVVVAIVTAAPTDNLTAPTAIYGDVLGEINDSNVSTLAGYTTNASKALYVLGTATIDASGGAVNTASGLFKFLGTVNASGGGPLTVGSATTVAKLVATDDLTLATVAGTVSELVLANNKTVTLDTTIGNISKITNATGAQGGILSLSGTPALANLAVGTRPLTITGAISSLTLTGNSGTGVITLPATAVTLNVGASASVAYAEQPADDAAVSLTATTGTLTVASLTTQDADGTAANLTTSGNVTFTGDVDIDGNLSAGAGTLIFNGDATIQGTAANTAASVWTFNGGTNAITGAVTVGTGGLTIAGKGGAVALGADITADSSKSLTVTAANGISIANGNKIVIANSGTVTAGDIAIATAGNLTATTDGYTLKPGAIVGSANTAKITVTTSVITVGSASVGGDHGATFDDVDVYLVAGTAGVTVQGGDSDDDGEGATTLTLKGAAQISGLTGGSSAETVDVGTFLSNAAGSRLSAVTAATSSVGAGNLIKVKASNASGTLTVDNASEPASAAITSATKATATGA